LKRKEVSQMSLLEYLLWAPTVVVVTSITLVLLKIIVKTICYEIKEFIDYVFYDIEPLASQNEFLGRVVDVLIY
jgi:hypothetical protein